MTNLSRLTDNITGAKIATTTIWLSIAKRTATRTSGKAVKAQSLSGNPNNRGD